MGCVDICGGITLLMKLRLYGYMWGIDETQAV